MAQGEPQPLVSVIVVNYHGADDTITCLRALAEHDYPELELICVDNSDEAARIREAVPGARVIEAGRNTGFAGGCNLGARHAKGTVLGFLNNDARPAPGWVSAAVAELRAQPRVAAVASKVLDWEGTGTDFVDGGLTWFGMGYKRHAGSPLADVPAAEHEVAKDVLFGTGSAMFVRASVFAELGGFDERFFMFYEDVDLGWRLNLRGWRVRYVPESLTYHRHHGTMASVDAPETGRETFLLERNALAALYKNLSDETLARALPAALALAVRRATARGELDATQLDLEKGVGPIESGDVAIPRTTLAGILAIDQFVEQLPSLAESRAVEQAARVRTDADLLPLLRKALEPAYPLPRYLAAHDILVEAFGIEKAFGQRRQDPGDHRRRAHRADGRPGDPRLEHRAGPVRRARRPPVTTNPLATPPPAPFRVSAGKHRELEAPVAWADIIVLQGHVLELAPSLKKEHSGKIVVADLYDPMHLELLEQGKGVADDKRAADLVGVTKVLDAQLERGDFFLCASERQRHFWLGHLAALGRLSPRLYDADPTTQSLLAVVPFGLSPEPPTRTGPGLRSSLGIGGTDHVVLWAGGVYSWFDPLTLVRAIDTLRRRRGDVRLVFLGMKHPNPEVAEMDIGARTIRLGGFAGADRQARLLQRAVGALPRAPELAARRELRRHHALRARRDDVRVPHPGARLPVGRAADRHHRRRRVRRPGAGRAARCGRPGRGRCRAGGRARKVVVRRGVRRGLRRADGRRRAAVHLARSAEAAGGVLPRPAPGRRPAARLGRPGDARRRCAAARCCGGTPT